MKVDTELNQMLHEARGLCWHDWTEAFVSYPSLGPDYCNDASLWIGDGEVAKFIESKGEDFQSDFAADLSMLLDDIRVAKVREGRGSELPDRPFQYITTGPRLRTIAVLKALELEVE